MSFLRRVFGGGREGSADGKAAAPIADAGAEAEDARRERELLAEDARRMSDELLARQLRYADRSWTPPAQGGPQRSDDAESSDRE